MLSERDVLVKQAQYKDLRREAEVERRLRQAAGAQDEREPGSPPVSEQEATGLVRKLDAILKGLRLLPGM